MGCSLGVMRLILSGCEGECRVETRTVSEQKYWKCMNDIERFLSWCRPGRR